MKQYQNIAEDYKALHAENFQLRDYIINMQSRLLELQVEVPELPENIDLSQPRPELPIPSPPAPPHPITADESPSQPSSAAPPVTDDLNSLNRIAVAGLGMRKHPNDDSNYMANVDVKRPRHDEDAEEVPEASAG